MWLYFHIQWNLFKPNLLETKFCVWNRQVFSLYRFNWQRFLTLGLFLKFSLYRITVYSRFSLYRITVYSRFSLYRITVYSRFSLYRITVFSRFSLYRITVYSRFGLYRFPCILYNDMPKYIYIFQFKREILCIMG